MITHERPLRITGSEDQIIVRDDQELAYAMFFVRLRDMPYPSMWETRTQSDLTPEGGQLWRREHPEHIEDCTGRSCRCDRV